MGELRKYTVRQNGYDAVLKLNDEDAERLGGTPVDDAATSSPVEPAADADRAPDASADAASKSRTAQNKARTGQNKAAE